MESAITYMPLLITSLALILVSFMRRTRRNRKTLWLITATIIWAGTLIWTLSKLGIIK